MSIRVIFIIVLLCVCFAAGAQRREVRKGNELYQQQKYPEAAAAYQKALQKNPQFVPGAFNLGNALILQKQYEAARKVMNGAAKTATDPRVQSSAQYNTGNTYMSEQHWQQAIEAYKEALRRNPGDADAQYNLSYALKKLKQEQQQQKDDKQQEDKQKQEKQKQNKKEQQKDDKKEEQGQEEQQRRQPQPSRLSEQQAENLLQALQQEERKVHDKMQKDKASPIRMEKDW